jgi:prepilin-type N-terminal cleavage/methylation domain-containing protein
MKFPKKKQGFTLIELLVVVAIIGVLATIVLASLSDARARARDAKRLADIRTIQTALEVYYLDNGTYPLPPRGGSFRDLMGTLPFDPIKGFIDGINYEYVYFGSASSNYCNGQMYILRFNLESRYGDGPNDGIEICTGQNFDYGNAFTVGVDRYGKFITPDMSGTLRE